MKLTTFKLIEIRKTQGNIYSKFRNTSTPFSTSVNIFVDALIVANGTIINSDEEYKYTLQDIAKKGTVTKIYIEIEGSDIELNFNDNGWEIILEMLLDKIKRRN